MFRRLSNSLPPDPAFPDDIEKLGYFINDHDQIRMISEPKSGFKYVISKNDRVNDNHKEAMNACIRRIVLSRLHDLSLQTLPLPFGSTPEQPHIPILTSPNLPRASRIILVLGDTVQDLGIFAYRMMVQSINTGCAVDFAQDALSTPSPADSNTVSEGEVGMVIGNPGQLIWSNIERCAMTHATWRTLPRKSAMHPPATIDQNRNRVPGHETVEAHVSSIFEQVLSSPQLANPNAKISVIALEVTARVLVQYLASNWTKWSGRVEAIVFGDPYYYISDLYPDAQSISLESLSDTTDKSHSSSSSMSSSFAEFISKRSRAYRMTRDPVVDLGEPCLGREIYGCNCYGSGEEHYSECTMPRAWQAMLNWLKLVWTLGDGFQEVPYQVEPEHEEQVLDGWGSEDFDDSDEAEKAL
ncbi:MAG: hypothetical protein Q9160_005748 [Pyrenula sp. 1 TL-2023]